MNHIKKLRSLKKHIVDSGYDLRIYNCCWDDGLQRMVDLEAFLESVFVDLFSSIDAQFAFGEPAGMGEFEADTAPAEIFQEELTASYHLGNQADVVEEMSRGIDKVAQSLTCVIGEAGSGKSTLLAYIHHALPARPMMDRRILYVHFAGASAASTSPFQLLRRLHHELAKSIALDWPIPDTFHALRGSLIELLKDVTGQKKGGRHPCLCPGSTYKLRNFQAIVKKPTPLEIE